LHSAVPANAGADRRVGKRAAIQNFMKEPI